MGWGAVDWGLGLRQRRQVHLWVVASEEAGSQGAFVDEGVVVAVAAVGVGVGVFAVAHLFQ